MEDIIAIVMVFGTGIVGLIAFSPIGRAIAQRIRGPAELPSQEMDELRDQVAGLSQQVSELAERQDFTERMLAQARDKGLLGSGGQP
jgi:hypothetical protein